MQSAVVLHLHLDVVKIWILISLTCTLLDSAVVTTDNKWLPQLLEERDLACPLNQYARDSNLQITLALLVESEDQDKEECNMLCELSYTSFTIFSFIPTFIAKRIIMMYESLIIASLLLFQESFDRLPF